MIEDSKKYDAMIKACNISKEELIETGQMKGLMGVYNLGLEHMLSYLEKNDKTKAITPTLWGDGYSDGELVYDMYDCQIAESITNYTMRNMITVLIAVRR